MGLSVTGTMLITTVLFAAYARQVWKWSPLILWPLVGLLGGIEGAFLVANLFKIPHGGWFTVAVAAVVFTLMTTWQTGRRLVDAQLRRERLTVERLAAQLAEMDLVRVPGTAVYLFSQTRQVPPSLLLHLALRSFAARTSIDRHGHRRRSSPRPSRAASGERRA
ncbi:MAG: Low affinity potassium transport system protein kup [Ilumatobacteraceae bacterium]|nr:Low affinity potassium transport system protein kup [Ilumatobacteraceae bacterium]